MNNINQTIQEAEAFIKDKQMKLLLEKFEENREKKKPVNKVINKMKERINFLTLTK